MVRSLLRMMILFLNSYHNLPTVQINIWHACYRYFLRSSSKLSPPIVSIGVKFSSSCFVCFYYSVAALMLVAESSSNLRVW